MYRCIESAHAHTFKFGNLPYKVIFLCTSGLLSSQVPVIPVIPAH